MRSWPTSSPCSPAPACATVERPALRWVDVGIVGAEEINVAAAISDGGPGVGILRMATKTADLAGYIPLTGSAPAALRRQQERRVDLVGDEPRSHYVFPGDIDGSVPPCARTRSQCDGLSTAGGRLSISSTCGTHAATVMLDAGWSYRTVADLLGDSEATLRLHYDGRSDVGKRKAIAALELLGTCYETRSM